ncbi:MAG: response regulator [Candidatus Omnitrophota bacterium]
MGGKVVLVIDDQQEMCKLVKESLEIAGDYKVAMAFSGREGLKAAKSIKPHLILLDVMMPAMDGFEVLKLLKENSATKSIPVVMLTAVDNETAKLKAMQLYDEDYLIKPAPIEKLRSTVDNVLRRRGL